MVNVRAVHHLDEYEPERKDIHGLPVVGASENNFWCPVPSGHHLTCHFSWLLVKCLLMLLLKLGYGGLELLGPREPLLSWSLLNFLIGFLVDFSQGTVELVLLWQRSGEAEVAHHDSALIVEEQVCWLDVPVHQVGRVEKLQRAQLVIQENFYVVFGNHGLWH